jgi:multimeric flavodoxin WrbA
MPLQVFAINCTLKRSASETSSTQRLLTQVLDALREHGTQGEIVHALSHNILPGVTSDEGPGDDWPKLRSRIVAADIFVLGTPVWLGQPSSVAKRVLERLDAFLGETDDRGRMPSFGKVACTAVVGNEDGAHHIAAELFQALNDVGFTIPAGGSTYWVGEAMGKTNYVDLPKTPEKVDRVTRMLASNAAHLAARLKESRYPGVPQKQK